MSKRKYRGRMPAGKNRDHWVVVDTVDAPNKLKAFFDILQRLRWRCMTKTHAEFLENGVVELNE